MVATVLGTGDPLASFVIAPNSHAMRKLAALIAFILHPLTAQADILVFAAASLKEPLDRIAAEHSDVTVSYGGSGALARQVIAGAPADIVLLANQAWMDVLNESSAVQSDSIIDIASNRLVMVGPAGSPTLELSATAIDTRRNGGRIAVGLTNAVPAGIYARQAFETLELWDDLAIHLAEVDNVRTALALVTRGQAPLGVVYQTDVRISDAVAEVAVFPTESHGPIRYTAALTAQADPDALAFLDALTGDLGQEILAAAGFLPPVLVGGQ